MPTIAQAQAKLNAGDYESWGVVKSGFIPKNTMPLALQLISEYVEAFEKMVAGQLRRANKVNTGSLSDSLRVETTETANGIIFEIFVNDYYKFVDQGVQGTGPNSRNTRSPYKYRDKMPPIVEILKWVRKNVNAARNEDQQRKLSKLQKKRRSVSSMAKAMQPRTLAFLIARKIKRQGLPYTGFWERSVNETFKDFDIKMSEALGIDIRVNLENMVKEIKKKK